MIRALEYRKWLINQSLFGETKTNNTLSYRKQDNFFLDRNQSKTSSAVIVVRTFPNTLMGEGTNPV